MRPGAHKGKRISSGHESTSGNREMVKKRSPREGQMAMNGYDFEHPYPGKPEQHDALVAGGPGVMAGNGARHAGPVRRVGETPDADNRRA